LWADLTNKFVLLTIFSLLAFAAIGFIDDFRQGFAKTQSRADRPKGKFTSRCLQLDRRDRPLGYGHQQRLFHSVRLPVLKHFRPDLVIHSLLSQSTFGGHLWPLAFVPFLFATAVVIVGSSNAVNLTDGLDGLAIGCTVIAAGAFTVLTYVSSNFRWATYLENPVHPRRRRIDGFCGALVGASLGFLWYNAHPAEIFMGDSARYPLGGTLGRSRNH